MKQQLKTKKQLLAVQIPECDRQQLRELGVKFELSASAIARRALQLGMAKLDKDGAFFAVPREEK